MHHLQVGGGVVVGRKKIKIKLYNVRAGTQSIEENLRFYTVKKPSHAKPQNGHEPLVGFVFRDTVVTKSLYFPIEVSSRLTHLSVLARGGFFV